MKGSDGHSKEGDSKSFELAFGHSKEGDSKSFDLAFGRCVTSVVN